MPADWHASSMPIQLLKAKGTSDLGGRQRGPHPWGKAKGILSLGEGKGDLILGEGHSEIALTSYEGRSETQPHDSWRHLMTLSPWL